MEGKKYTILVVDDEQEIVDTLYDFFINWYKVFKATNAKEAVDIIENNQIDLVISDQRMPGTTGVEMFQKIDTEHPTIGKVLLTGYADIQAVTDAINKGHIDKYISKPWDDDDITRIVIEVLQVQLKRSINERNKIEEQLILSTKMANLGELTAGIIHEINNPLAFISGNIGNLGRNLKKILGLIECYDQEELPEKTKAVIDKKKEDINYSYLQTRIVEILDKYKISADRMKKIITDMKSFSRRETDNLEEADLNKAIDATLTIIIHEYKNRVEIKKDYGIRTPLICNISKLNQVFMNILVNACHAIPEKGEIVIKTRIESDMAIVEISDTGEGITEEVRKKMFEPFFTTKAAGIGTGLGLSISHKIIEQHNGEILVNSKVGEGTTFIIKFPIISKKEQ